MNLIPKLAEMLGVEIEEEFKIKDSNSTIYKLMGTGLFTKSATEDTSIWHLENGLIFRDLLVGVSKIEKIPFKPKEGKKYWSVRWGREQQIFIGNATWANDDIDYRMLYCGNVFRTESEAEKHKYEIYEKLTGKKWEEGAK